jgi:hypothetical protein
MGVTVVSAAAGLAPRAKVRATKGRVRVVVRIAASSKED